jgi:hypothetical protein
MWCMHARRVMYGSIIQPPTCMNMIENAFVATLFLGAGRSATPRSLIDVRSGTSETGC